LKQTLKILAISALLLGIFSFAQAPEAHAASLNVNSTAETVADDGLCTLREAIGALNNTTASGMASGECAAGDGSNDTITLPSGTILLTGNLPQINKPVNLTGQGMGKTVINGNNGSFTGFSFIGTASENVNISKLTVNETRDSGIFTVNVNFFANQIEVYGGADKPGSTTDMAGGIAINNTLGAELDVEITDTYIHDVQTFSGAISALLISGTGASSGVTNTTLANVTVSNIRSSTAQIVNGIVFSMFEGVEHTMTADVSNITINNLEGAGTTYGMAAVAVSEAGDASANITARNMTVSHIRGSDGVYGGVSGVAAGGIAMTSSFSSSVSITLQNALLSDVLLSGNGTNCAVADLSSIASGTGAPILGISSSGGNLSSDNSCTPYFTQPTDRNNVGNLTSTLGNLSDNGGYVPTIPLLAGSPAIDAGVDVSGLAADARLVSRPQGAAFDSGSYEYIAPANTSSQSLASTGQSQLMLYALVSIVLLLALLPLLKYS
jgi:CSLREA domain-containing protein